MPSRSTDPSTENTAPPRSAHVRLGDVPRTQDLVECRGRASSARRRDDGDDEATGAGLRLSVGERSNFKKILRTRKIMVMRSNKRGE